MDNLIMERDFMVVKQKTFKNIFLLIFFSSAVVVAFVIAAFWR
jgi:hypothetical protein